ncbi:MAG: DUF2236 domain-containing protein [Acidimicrobiia bacterium]|nr:DUF2236 domain-containing protein [Acidimicrobiia bacterium]
MDVRSTFFFFGGIGSVLRYGLKTGESSWRSRVRASATGPFGHADYPLLNTLDYPGDPGVCGPGSASWSVLSDVAAFVGGIRALLVQSAHPEVVAGVADHSRYRVDPLGRLSRTSSYVTATTFGARKEAEAAVEAVRLAHQGLIGTSHRGRPYSADNPHLSAWVHNVLTDSFLSAHRAFGAAPLGQDQADLFVAEQARIGQMMNADPIPRRAETLAGWVADHPDLDFSPGMRDTVRFLADPPLDRAQKAGYRMLYIGAVSTIPARIRAILGIRGWPGGRRIGRGAVRFLRSVLGFSPSWELALIRTGSPIPEGVFCQPLPVDLPPDWSPYRLDE